VAMLEDAASWLASQTLESLSVPVLYRTRGGERFDARAVIGSTVYEAQDGGGVVVRTETRDFIVPAAQLPREPSRGDSVVWRGTVYEVLAPDGSPCWRWSDAYHNMKRIHTKEVGKEEDDG